MMVVVHPIVNKKRLFRIKDDTSIFTYIIIRGENFTGDDDFSIKKEFIAAI
jgi:hypothetical protein